MIEKTFQLIKGLGPKTEHKLWDQGLTDWDDILKSLIHKGPIKFNVFL